MNILFVCTGNTCRSPMAECMFRQKLKEENMNHFVRSAGIMTADLLSASNYAIQTLKKRNLDLSDHKSYAIDEDIVDHADLILAMTNRHKEWLMESFPLKKTCIFTLDEYTNIDDKDIDDQKIDDHLLTKNSQVDIIDPYGGDLEVYESCANQIEKRLDKLIEKLKQHEMQ